MDKLTLQCASLIVRSLTLRNFRSYVSETFTFDNKINLICGENAQGKTNMLEAIHFLLAFKPFKQVTMKEIVKFEAEECGIKGEIDSDSGLDEVHILISGERKIIKLNGKIVYRASKAIGRYSIVSFLPSDIELIKGGPQSRRKYLDALICALEPVHLKDLRLYHRSLIQRNALLSMSPGSIDKKAKGLNSTKTEIWDEKLAEIGARLISRRIKFIGAIEPCLNNVYKMTSGIDTKIGMYYKSSFDLESDLQEGLNANLRSSFEKDRQVGHTSVGPHRDVVSFTIDGMDASIYASQGEAKNLAFALKASEIELIQNTLKRTPVLLLDDITSELDDKRKGFLFDLLQGFAGQVFITTTSLKEILDVCPQLRGRGKVLNIIKTIHRLSLS